MRLHSLIDKVASPQTLRRAYRFCARRSSSTGSDHISWARYRQRLSAHIDEVAEAILQEMYLPAPYKCVSRADRFGKWRTFYIPTVQDRMVQRAIRLCLEPYFEKHVFTDCAFEYRPKRHPSMAFPRVEQLLQLGRSWILEVDVENFSLNASRTVLDATLGNYIADGKFLRLVQRCLGEAPEGLPTGNGLTPFLANIYLHEVDVQLRQHSIDHLRFCDTFLLFVSSQEEVYTVHQQIEQILCARGLRLNATKTRQWIAPHVQDLLRQWA